MATVSESERTVDPARAEIVVRVRALGEKGLYLQAYQASREAGPLHAWTGTTETVLAARLAYQLAAPTLANWLVRRAWRADPSDWEARFYNAFRIFRRRGPYWAWRWTAQAGDPDPASPCDTPIAVACPTGPGRGGPPRLHRRRVAARRSHPPGAGLLLRAPLPGQFAGVRRSLRGRIGRRARSA